jgi:hypothetical protein
MDLLFNTSYFTVSFWPDVLKSRKGARELNFFWVLISVEITFVPQKD